ncbi:MAG: DUF302 domain-containing protein [Candidatus Delongbacteria bacterium]|nr:DUF302 domain-containing protein [Candidatus Delongbacteria bacterium]
MRTTIFTMMAFLLVGFTSCGNAPETPENNTSEKYYFSKTVEGDFEEVTTKVKAALKEEGFSVVTEIDMAKALTEKLDEVNMQPYRILGVCNAQYAYATIQEEENIGVFLPCKLIIKQVSDNKTEVIAVNPEKLMKMLGNENLDSIAGEVSAKFKKVLKQL